MSGTGIVHTGMLLGNVRSLCKMLANVFCLFFPLKGVRPYSISYNRMPKCVEQVHESETDATAVVINQVKITR